MNSRSFYKFVAVYILYGVCIQRYVSIFVIRKHIVRWSVKCVVSDGVVYYITRHDTALMWLLGTACSLLYDFLAANKGFRWSASKPYCDWLIYFVAGWALFPPYYSLIFYLQLCQYIRYVSPTDTFISVHWIIKVKSAPFGGKQFRNELLHHSDLRQGGECF